jgi:hypothetical protein
VSLLIILYLIYEKFQEHPIKSSEIPRMSRKEFLIGFWKSFWIPETGEIEIILVILELSNNTFRTTELHSPA